MPESFPILPGHVRRLSAARVVRVCRLAALLPVVAVAASPACAWEDGPVARQVSEQDRVKIERERGDIRPLRELLSSAQQVGRGAYLGVETGSHVYRFKFRRAGGEVVWVDMDSRSGEVVRVRD